MRPRDFFPLLGSAGSGWVEDNALRLSAALAYYSIFSLAPLLVLSITIAGFVFGDAAARGQVAGQMRQLAGERAAEAIQALVLSTSRMGGGLSATVLGVLVMLFGASSVFLELKDALNTIWGVRLKPGRAVLGMIRQRTISFTIVLSVGFMLLASLVISAACAFIGNSLHVAPPVSHRVWEAADILSSFIVVTILFAMVFKLLPNVHIRWRDAWPGAALTGLLFTAGKFVIGIYLGTSGVASYYGAAGSAIIILLWVYYSACILFFGAEFTKAWFLRRGGKIVPDSHAEPRRPPGASSSGHQISAA